MYRQLVFLLHPVTIIAALTYNFPADILSPDGTSPLEFAVGSDVTLQCRLKPSSSYDVKELVMLRSSNGEFYDVSIVRNSTIEVTLHNVSAPYRDVIVCFDKRSKRPLVTQGLCVDYAPGNFNLRCKLHPDLDLRCCVTTEQRHNNLCDVRWTLEYHQTVLGGGQWRAFPGSGLDPETLCASWPLQRNHTLQYYSNLSVRAVASNQIGSANTSITFVPATYAVPGPVKDLKLQWNQSSWHNLTLQWERNWTVDDLTCEDMGLYYDVVLTSSYDGRRWSEKVGGCQNLQHEYTFSGLAPHTLYNVTVVPRSHHFTGPASSRQYMTPQSKPLKAPEIVGWSYSTRPADGVVLYWKKFKHHEKGGPIHTYDVTVTAEGRRARSYSFNVSEDPENSQAVTTPSILYGCVSGCEVTLSASTAVGPSPTAVVTIPAPPKDFGLRLVSDGALPAEVTVHAVNGSRRVSWEGDVYITSVVWCFGSRFPEDSTLVKYGAAGKVVALTQTQKKHVDIGEDHFKLNILASEGELPQLCEKCQWHFAVRLSSSDSGVGTKTDTDSDSQWTFTDKSTGTGTGTYTGTDSDTSINTDLDAGSVIGTHIGTDIGIGTGTHKDIDISTDTEFDVGSDRSDGGTSSSRLVWAKPDQREEGPTDSTNYFYLAVPFGVALLLTVAFLMCGLCLGWAIRRLKAKAKKFSVFDLPGPEKKAEVPLMAATYWKCEENPPQALCFVKPQDTEARKDSGDSGVCPSHEESSLPPTTPTTVTVEGGYIAHPGVLARDCQVSVEEHLASATGEGSEDTKDDTELEYSKVCARSESESDARRVEEQQLLPKTAENRPSLDKDMLCGVGERKTERQRLAPISQNADYVTVNEVSQINGTLKVTMEYLQNQDKGCIKLTTKCFESQDALYGMGNKKTEHNRVPRNADYVTVNEVSQIHGM